MHQVSHYHFSTVPTASRTGSRKSFSEDIMEINSRTSSISVISDEGKPFFFFTCLVSNPAAFAAPQNIHGMLA